MAAPSNRQHVRLKVSFQGVNLEPTWLFIEFSKFKTIEDIHTVILSRYFPDKPCKLKLFLHDCVLPKRENCLILENNDAIIVDCQEFYIRKSAADHKSIKSKKRTARNTSPEGITSYEEVDAHKRVMKKKKNKRSKVSVDLSIEHESMQMDDSIHLRDKNQSLQKAPMEAETVMMDGDLSHACRPAKDCSNKRSRNRDEGDSEHFGKKHRTDDREASSALPVAPVTEDMEMVTVSCSTSSLGIKDTMEMANATPGKDSDVPVEHKAKRKHRKRKRKTQSPSTSSTTPSYRKPEQCATRVHANIGSQDKRKRQDGGKHVHFGSDDSGDEASEKDEDATAHEFPATSVCKDSAMVESNYANCKQDRNSETFSPGGTKEAPLKEYNPTDEGDGNTSQPLYVEKYEVDISHVNENVYNNDILSSHNSNADVYFMASDSLSGPTVINELFSSKQSSPVVFTRPRQKKYRAFSKEEQLNTSSSNRSIIFQNPPDDGRSTPTKPIEVIAIPITVDYQRFPVLQGFPRAGDKIAYKDLVLNDTYEPVLSAFKEAVVVGFDAISKNVDLEIKRQAETPRKYGKFDVVLEDDTGSLTNIPNEAEKGYTRTTLYYRGRNIWSS